MFEVAESTERLKHSDNVPNQRHHSGMDVYRLAYVLWKGKWFISIATILSASISVLIALHLPNQYKAYAVLTPASTTATSSLARLAGQFSGLAALAGVSVGAQGENDKTVLAMELIKSWGFQEKFIRDNHLEVPVFAATGWNRASDKIVIDPELYDERQKKWVRKFRADSGESAEPNGWELYEKFSKRISITQDKKTDLVTLSVEYYSPYIAKDWVDGLIIAVNKHLQDQDRLEASKSIKYLQDKMNETSLAEMKSVFARLIEEQTKTLMLADVSEEYALKTLSPAKIPEKKSTPNRIAICVLGTVVGVFLSVFFCLIWSGFDRRTNDA